MLWLIVTSCFLWVCSNLLLLRERSCDVLSIFSCYETVILLGRNWIIYIILFYPAVLATFFYNNSQLRRAVTTRRPRGVPPETWT
jgi:hypothetical protein